MLIAVAPIVCAEFKLADSVKQGQVLRVEGEGAMAEFLGLRVPFFQAAGLVPVPVTQSPGTFPLQVLDSRGGVLFEKNITVLDGRYPRQNIRASKSMQALKPMPGEREAIEALKAAKTSERRWAEPFLSPTSDCRNSPFGVKRYHNNVFSGRFHGGVDLRSPQGRPAYAATGGAVRIARMFRLHGGTIGIDHGQAVVSLYLHLSKLAVPEGTVVKPGDLVGYVGATGFATGPHLHWALYVHGVAVQPEQWTGVLPPCQPRR